MSSDNSSDKDRWLFLLIPIAFWAFLVFSQFVISIADFSLDGCSKPIRRIEYLFPGHKLMCWSFERVGK